MAINIFSGGSKSSGPRTPASNNNAAAAPTTVQTASGKNLFGKFGTILGKVGGIAAKYGNLIPGVGGIVSTIGKAAESINDPEWWMNIPGTGVSTNIPLSKQTYATNVDSFDAAAASRDIAQIHGPVTALRPSLVEFHSATNTGASDNAAPYPVISPTESMISTYLMQNVRKVVNAIPLQQVNAYRDVFTAQATIYAYKKHFDKLIFMAQTSKPWLPAMTDGSFPILAPENYATLVGFRDRLAEYCKASVRLPHTLCQYLTWRYGRIYRMGQSEKSGLVIYSPLPLDTQMSVWTLAVNKLLGFVADDTTSFYGYEYSTSSKSAAQADLYNAYRNHVIDVPVPDDTQYHYDPKEFVLRTNCDIGAYTSELGPATQDLIYMDSQLDNKTTFMASTVSTRQSAGDVLFPISQVFFYFTGTITGSDLGQYIARPGPFGQGVLASPIKSLSGSWNRFLFDPKSCATVAKVSDPTAQPSDVYATYQLYFYKVSCAMLCKACECYNMEVYLGAPVANPNTAGTVGYIENTDVIYDLTAPSTDLALCSFDILSNTQVYAFANLVYDGVLSYTAKEKPKAIAEATEVAKDVVKDMTAPSTVVV